jgi:hypothetical protein
MLLSTFGQMSSFGQPSPFLPQASSLEIKPILLQLAKISQKEFDILKA